MASFGWKRKAGEKVSKAVVQQFEDEAEKVEEGAQREEQEEVDWQQAIKRRRELLEEDCTSKSRCLQEEGALLAEQGRHWEAIKKWDEAIQLTPENPSLYDMKSQVLTILHEVFPAVKAAEMAVKLRPLWWEAWQTLGRAQLNLGEVDLAVKSFQIAIHLCPSESSLWLEDLQWACRLQQQHTATKERSQMEEETRRQVLDAPELQQDFDFESEEVVAACEAVAQRQSRYEAMRRSALVVDAQGNIQKVPAAEGGRGGGGGEEGEETEALPKELFVKARGL
ncbi:unnamed protein product [Knipowitschia caucasica]|uniref:Tetratricopeptide repeat domain 33 n=1 Tax=Knipowitschia caucasica TaxID=637954 RepID=A0AAV2IUP1_KNICA